MAMRLGAQGIDPQQWLTEQLQNNDGMLAELKEASATAVKVDLALRAVAQAEELECSDDELDVEIEAAARQIGQKPQRVRQEFERGGQLAEVRSDIRKRKALDWLLERVEIVDEEGHPIDRADFEISADNDADTDMTTDDDTEIDEMETQVP
jgi:trigger factor